MVKLSLIIPGKDAAPFLPHLFSSILLQTKQHPLQPEPMDRRDLEIIVINDGSTDDTPAVLDEASQQFEHFQVITNRQAKGPSHGRNQGIAAAQGEYIEFLDADDWLSPNMMRTLFDAIRHLQVDFVRTDTTHVQGSSRTLRRAPMSLRNMPLNPRAGILPAATTTMVDYPLAAAGIYDRRMVDAGLLHFPEQLVTAEDRVWTWKHYLNAKSFAVVDSAGLCYRRGVSTSLTQIFDERQLQFTEAYARVFAMLEDDPEGTVFFPKAVRTWLAMLHHHTDRYAKARKAMKEDPDAPQVDPKVFNGLTQRGRELSHRIPEDILLEQFDLSSRARKLAISTYMPDTILKKATL